MQVIFQILRQQPHKPPHSEQFCLDVPASTTILDSLNQIKWEQDGSLAFRKNCRNTICGSCAMRINGRSTLACKENIGAEIERLAAVGALQVDEQQRPVMTIAPLGNLPVVKDLVVKMDKFWDNLDAVDPYVSTASRQQPDRETIQTPEQRAALNQSGNCILCGACYSECNAAEVNPEFVGPHALAKAYRTLADTRDDRTEERIATYNQGTAGVWGCTRCYYCNTVCPMEVAPMDQISKLKHEILERNDEQASRAIRHRKVMVELVKDGGWIDERKFGLKVVGNYLRDLPGLLSLGPLGLRMLAKGKFPLTFEPSEGTAQVRSLIESVQQQTVHSKESK
ncbi:MAG: succinate dehydrogenase/fumarate reductase iron-sulfur subunit, partial [Cyanobacteria bacterium P01_H01_bin.121]